jgi:hypothetical protein
VCVAVAAACGPIVAEPSPKSKLYVAIGVASVSVDADASAVTPSGVFPEAGLTLSFAFGGRSVAVTRAVAVDESPAVSFTVTVTV